MARLPRVVAAAVCAALALLAVGVLRPSGPGRAPAGPPRPAPGELSFKDRASLRRALADVRSDEAALIATVRQDCKQATGTWKPNAANLTCRARFHRRSVPDVAAAHDLVRRLGAAASPGRCQTALAGLGPALAELTAAHRRAADWLDRAAANARAGVKAPPAVRRRRYLDVLDGYTRYVYLWQDGVLSGGVEYC